MLDPVHNQGLRLCLGAFRTSPVESWCIDAYEPSLGARRAKLYLVYASKIKSLSKYTMHDAMSDKEIYEVVWCKAECHPYFWIRIKQFLIASYIDFSDILETPS